ncbi:MAG TPA: adenine deaminase [Phycisphaerae bacterium]|nr:adenine deaminase [Phycisphaerae bacterium]
MHITANVVSPFTAEIQPATVEIHDGRIAAISPCAGPAPATFLLPGFVDAHVHIESSMLTPAAFARLAVRHGTVATVSDPHEIANVLGLPGIHFMATSGRSVPFTFCWGAPACVPATAFESPGAAVTPADIEALFQSNTCRYLSEVMNFPGILAGDPDLLAKLAAAKKRNLPIDGHAPGLAGDAAARYFAAGIQTDHECVAHEEALHKIRCGAHILIREGSAAKNFDALRDLLNTHPDRTMLCSDDKHPDDLLAGHINRLVNRALAGGIPLRNILRAACVNPVEHYRLPVGLLRVGDFADFMEVESLDDFSTGRILRTFIRGQLVAERGRSLIDLPASTPAPNAFAATPRTAGDFALAAQSGTLRAIEALDGQLLTRELFAPARISDGLAIPDPARDLLKIAVINRYAPAAPPAIAFIRGFGLTQGAIASSVAHDSHNIVAVGASDSALAAAVNAVIHNRGGLAAVDDAGHEESLPLPVAGLMSDQPGEAVAAAYARLQHMARQTLGSTLTAPFMTLSFMALLVIPALKLSDRGLFDAAQFRFTSPFA